jgi:hypothetical protein
VSPGIQSNATANPDCGTNGLSRRRLRWREGQGESARSSALASLTLSGEPCLQRHLRSRRVLAAEELKTFPARGADAAPAADQRMLRKQRRLNRKDVIARDVPDGVDALSSARLSPSSNAKFESVMPIRFQELIDIAVMPGWDGRPVRRRRPTAASEGDHNAMWPPGRRP